MKGPPLPPPEQAEREIAALIETLHVTGQRLDALTGGEMDSVVDRSGRLFLMRGVQEQLQRAEATRQAAILSALPAHIALLDTAGVIVSVNEAWRRFGLDNALHSPGHAVGINYLEICDTAQGNHAEEAREVASGIRAVLEGRATTFSLEYPCHSPGEQRWFLMTVTPMPGNPPKGAVVMHLDITAQRAAQASMRESDNRKSAILALSLDCLIVIDHRGMIVEFNPAAEKTFGFSQEQALGRSMPALIIPPRLRDAHSRGFAHYLASGEGPILGKRIELSAIRADGTEFPIELSIMPIGTGRAPMFAASLRDITARKKSEARILRDAEALLRFSSAMDVTADAIYLVDRTSMEFIHVNETACRMQGMTREELIALGPAGLLALPRAELERAYDAIIASGEEAKPLEMLRNRPDGSRVWVELRRHALKSGTGWTIVTLVRDISDQKQATLDLRNSESRFRSLTMLSSDWFWEQDEQHRFSKFSGGEGVQGWGPDQEKAIGLHRWDLGDIIPLSSGWEAHKALLDAHKSFRNFEYSRTLGDGSLQYVETSGEPIFDESGAFTGYRGVATEISKRKLAEQNLLRFRAAMDSSGDAIVLIDRTSMRYVDVNQTLCDLVGYTREEVIGMTPMELFGGERDTLEHDYDALITDRRKRARTVESFYRHKNGSRIPIESRRRALRTEAGWLIVATARDVTDRKASDRKISRLNRVYAMLSGINALIVRAQDRNELFTEACRIAVEVGDFAKAWLGIVDESSRELTMAAALGGDPRFFAALAKGLAAKYRSGEGLVARALSTQRPVISNDAVNDAEVLLKDFAGQEQIRALAILPLIVSGKAVGVFTLNSDAPDFFDDEEMKLLAQLADDIAHALDHFDKADKLARITRVNSMLSGVNAAIARIHERQELFQEVCRIAVETGSLPSAWIAVVNQSGTRLRPLAFAGSAQSVLATIEDRLLLGNDAPHGYGVSTTAVRERRAVVVNDVGTSALIRNTQAYAGLGTRSVAALPLTVAGQVIGVFTLDAMETGFFDNDEMALLKEMAANIEFALVYMKKETDVRRLTRVYAVLSGINSAIVRTRERVELYREVCRIAVAEGGFFLARVIEVDSSGRTTIAATTEPDASLFQGLLDKYNADPVHSGILIGAVVRDGLPLFSNDVSSDPRLPNRDALTKDGNYALAMLPMLIDKRVAGIIFLRAPAGAFNAEERRLLTEMTANTSFALELIDKRKRIEYLAYNDDLTGLPNRNQFLREIADRIAGGAGYLAVFLIDLERFKNINDSLGRSAGDDLLRQVAAWITAHKTNSTLVARFGADQFALLMPDVEDEHEATRRLNAMLDAIATHSFRLVNADFRIAVKVGVSIYPVDGAAAETLLNNAEAALKKAKTRGERYLFHTQAMTASVAGVLSLENQLRLAIDNSEFVLHYQPKVRLSDGRLTGGEALIRWNDPRTGLVPPGRFIPILEETGMIYEVGRWALRQAIADYLRWRAAGLPAVRIAVNVSPLQLRNRAFNDEIAQVIGVDAGAPAGLELEITESLIMEDVKHSIASLQAIRSMGVTVAIDDFGTGFSSLSYLAKLPVDTLKIDRSFITSMTAGAQGLSLVSTIISLAHSMKLKVVAEGVETEEQSRLLKLLRCDDMQGFLFSKPVPADIFEAKFLAPAP